MKLITSRISILFLLIFLCSLTPVVGQDKPDALAKYRNGDFAEAVAICLNEIEYMPRSMDSYTVLGWSLIALSRYDEALSYTEKAYAIAPTDPRIVEILGEANYYLGNDVKAIALFERYTVLLPTGERIDTVYYFLGEIFIRLGEFNHADIALSTAVYHSPNVSRWWSRLGYAREMAADYSSALEAYQKAISLNPALTEAARGRTRVLEKIQSG